MSRIFDAMKALDLVPRKFASNYLVLRGGRLAFLMHFEMDGHARVQTGKEQYETVHVDDIVERISKEDWHERKRAQKR